MDGSIKKPVEQELLLRKLRSGEESAYEVLFKEYYVTLSLYAHKFVSDSETAKEIVQDLFVALYEKREHLHIDTSLNAYLYRSVRNKCFNYIDHGKHKEKYNKYIQATHNDGVNSTDGIISRAELESALFKAIGELPEKCRIIFKMNRFEGLSNSDIADQLDISKRTVETQISKALKILRSKLRPYLEESIAAISLLTTTIFY